VRPGSDYPPVLEKAVRRAPNLLLVLTPAARAILQGQGGGTSRESTVFPDDPGRWIPHEILLARKAGNHIVVALPTTTNRARMVDESKAAPAEGNPLRTRELPEPLQFLARINPVRFRSDEFHAESVRQLVEALKLP